MKLLLCKNVETLGIVGDVVEVKPGYGRNYLLPNGLATEPTQSNMKILAQARKQAEVDRERQRVELAAMIERLADVEVTIRSRANESGHLYGSVGPKEISAALIEEGHYVTPEQVALAHPIRQLDSTEVPIRFTDDLQTTVKVWVVRDKTDEDDDDGEEGEREGEREPEGERETPAGMEAGENGDLTQE